MGLFATKSIVGIILLLIAVAAFGRGLAYMHTVQDFIGIMCIVVCSIIVFALGIIVIFDAYQSHKDQVHEFLEEK